MFIQKPDIVFREFFKVTEVLKLGHPSFSSEDDPVLHHPEASVSDIQKLTRSVKTFLLFPVLTWPFVGKQPICKCLFSFSVFTVPSVSGELQAFRHSLCSGLWPLVPWKGTAKDWWDLFLSLQ